jgi:hypothetical protein
MPTNVAEVFPRYTQYDPSVPVWCITPGKGACIHRFFDTSPISPSGRYVALTRLPQEDRLPVPGEKAEVVLVDLASGEERVVAETAGWDTQLGAQAQWGADDGQLCFNDVDTATWRPYGVVLDPSSGARKELDGTVYMVSPDGTKAASPCLLRTARTQEGYGVLAPPEAIPENRGAVDDDGVFVTDLGTGEARLLVSHREIVETLRPENGGIDYSDGGFYGFHVKWNPRGDRLMLVWRFLPKDPSKRMQMNVVTMKADGSDLHVAIPAALWARRGHHPNWCPDGEHVLMNLARRAGDRELWFMRIRHDGSGFEWMHEQVQGSGHPSLHPDGIHFVTDVYTNAPLAFGDGTVPIRLVDLETGTDAHVVRVNTKPEFAGPAGELRVDPHPAWDCDFRRIVFNAFPDGTRRVFLADLEETLI